MSAVSIAQYYLNADNKGFYVAGLAGALQYAYTWPDTPNAVTNEDQIALGAMAGYRWFATPSLHVTPFVGVECRSSRPARRRSAT